MNIAFIGIGNVGFALADNLQKLGHEVTIAAREKSSDSVSKALARNSGLKAAPFTEAFRGAELVFLATPFAANASILSEVASLLDGKVLVDCTNPIGAGLTHALGSQTSGSEQAQSLLPGAQVVKAFTIYGFENFLDSRYPGPVRPAMLLTGDDAAAKATVSELCRALGWEPVDAGPLASSLHLEHMTLLWIKMARLQGMGPNFTWGLLRRPL